MAAYVIWGFLVFNKRRLKPMKLPKKMITKESRTNISTCFEFQVYLTYLWFWNTYYHITTHIYC